MSLMTRSLTQQQTDSRPERKILDANVLLTELKSNASFSNIMSLMQSDLPRAKTEASTLLRVALREQQWQLLDNDTKENIFHEALNMMFGLGPLENLLADDEITEIMINSSNRLFIEKHGLIEEIDNPFFSNDDVNMVVDKILAPLGRHVDELSPLVDARLASGHRVNVVISPISVHGTIVTIRKFSKSLLNLGDLERLGSLEKEVTQFLEQAVHARKNIAVSGGTGSGKTTLLNAMSCAIDANERIVTIEDLAELQFNARAHVVTLEARPKNSEGFGEITIRNLVANALRMRPDRIVVGECRGAEALDMLQAMNTGHDGSLTTLHANSPKDAISRLCTMVRYAVDLPVDIIEKNIASALDYIVQIKRDKNGNRYLSDIVKVTTSNTQSCVTIPFYTRRNFNEQGAWVHNAQDEAYCSAEQDV